MSLKFLFKYWPDDFVKLMIFKDKNLALWRKFNKVNQKDFN